MKNAYTGIGSVETPPHALGLMCQIAAGLASRGLVLRSGGDEGAEGAFEDGAADGNGLVELYVPWRDFNGCLDGHDVTRSIHYSKACGIAAEFHPAWGSLKQGPRKRMAAYVFKVLGQDLQSPSRFVVCWALNPKFDIQKRISDVSGGAGVAVRLAYDMNIPVFHLDIHDHIKRIDHLCGTNFSSSYGMQKSLDPFAASLF